MLSPKKSDPLRRATLIVTPRHDGRQGAVRVLDELDVHTERVERVQVGRVHAAEVAGHDAGEPSPAAAVTVASRSSTRKPRWCAPGPRVARNSMWMPTPRTGRM